MKPSVPQQRCTVRCAKVLSARERCFVVVGWLVSGCEPSANPVRKAAANGDSVCVNSPLRLVARASRVSRRCAIIGCARRRARRPFIHMQLVRSRINQVWFGDITCSHMIIQRCVVVAAAVDATMTTTTKTTTTTTHSLSIPCGTHAECAC